MQSSSNASVVSPVKAQSQLTSLLQQHQQAQQQQQQMQQSVVATSNHVVLTSVHPSSVASSSSSVDDSMSIDAGAAPAGQIARSLSIPIFAAAAAAAGNTNGNANGAYNTPNKRTKTSSGTPQHTPPTQPASALTLMMQQTAAAAAAASSAGSSPAGMSPGTYYRGVAAMNSQQQPVHRSSMITVPTVTPQSNLQKRRNSSTSLHLSPHHGPQAMPVNGAMMSSPSQQPIQYRKPPAYPSNPSTPASASRSIPINITSGNKSGNSSVVMSPGAGAMTPPGTPPVIPMPRAVMPANPLTPALAPDRSIAITNAQGNVIQRVNSKEMMKAMDNAEEIILPAAAVDHHHHRHKHHHQHKTRSMNQNAAQQQQQQQAATAQIQPHSATAASPQPSPEPMNNAPHPLAPITPVKHLVKLSSLSSLSSLITPPAASPSASPSPQPSSSPSMSPQPPQTTAGTDSPTMGSRTHSPATTASTHPSSSPPAIPPTYIILDIDETIHINAHSPCLMMCEKGLEMYQKIISSHGNYKHVSYTQKSQLTKTLQAALQSKRTVEHHTSDLLNTLQAASHPKDGVPPSNNIKIFGLTARFSHMASTTRKELLKLNIDLEKSSPFPMSVRKKNAHAQKDGTLQFSPQQSPTNQERSLTPSPILCASVTPLGSSPSLTSLQLPAASQAEYFPDVSWVDHPSFGTDARYQQGVIYTNACEKGPVLQRFLEFLWGKIEEDNHEMLETHEAAQQLYFQQYMSGLDSPAVPSITDPSPAGHSMLNGVNHAVSSPITIGGAGTSAAVTPAASTKPKGSPGSTPSPPSGDMSLLAAASSLANRKARVAARRDSRSTDLLSLPDSSPHADSMHIHSPSASPTGSPPPPPMLSHPIMSHLPTRIIFIDDRLQNCFSVYESLSAQTLFDKFYNHPTKRPHLKHVPHVLEVYTCHYVPAELAQHAPTNQTKADAAATAANGDQPDMELIETQIHHFLTHGEILNDPKGREMVTRIKSDASKAQALAQEKLRLEREEQAKAAALAFVAQEQSAAAAAAAAAASVAVPSPSPTSDMMDVSHGGSAMEEDPHPAPSASQADTIMAVTPRHCSVTVQ